MLTLSSRLATLAAKAKAATRTAKDGEEYSQLVLEVTDIEVSDTEVNALFGSPNAFRCIKALHTEVKGVSAIEVEDKFEDARVVLRTAAVSAQNGPEFTFAQATVDHVTLAALEGDGILASFRLTTKPALDANFGELIAKLGHTVMVEVSAQSPADQQDLPLSTVTDNGEQERMSNTGRQIAAAAAKKARKERPDKLREAADEAFH